MSVRVTLEWFEVLLAASVGINRRVDSIRFRRSMTNAYYNPGKWATWGTDVEGACGEMAFAKFCGTYWNGSVGTFQLPDVGRLQVRTSERVDARLIVKPNDPDGDHFVLVTGAAPIYDVVGYYHGGEAKRPEWWVEFTDGNHRSAFFVPRAALLDPDRLRRAVWIPANP